ncbi:hypothetical protein ABT369_06945 [Dactylosporangium sp. NPDC000244]|uniref:hypothetical protein n=1 Tax=Dactylosporangium sp. NPDC000244 TaxID=3154365 RepID=UPI00331B40F8
MAEYLRVFPRYGLTRRQIERTDRLRRAGDWAAACVEAGIAVECTLAGLDAGLRARVEADLPFFAPDLLRWHAIRMRHHSRLNYTSHELRDRGDELTLPVWVRADGAQAVGIGVRSVPPYRSRLHIAGPGEFSAAAGLDETPEYWDVRHAPALITRCGGRDPHAAHVYALLAAGRTAEAWTAAGFDVDLDTHHEPHPTRERLFRANLTWNLGDFTPALPVLAATVRAYARRHGVAAVWLTAERAEPVRLVVDRLDAERPRLRGEWYGSGWLHAVPRLPVMLQDRPPDYIDLLAGRATAADLHPLVAAALVPDEPATGPRALHLPEPAEVPCGDEIHHVGATLQVPHPAEWIERELALHALGGPVPGGCAGVVFRWRAGRRGLPEPLEGFREELRERIRYGEADTLAALRDEGLAL